MVARYPAFGIISSLPPENFKREFKGAITLWFVISAGSVCLRLPKPRPLTPLIALSHGNQVYVSRQSTAVMRAQHAGSITVYVQFMFRHTFHKNLGIPAWNIELQQRLSL